MSNDCGLPLLLLDVDGVLNPYAASAWPGQAVTLAKSAEA
jgi:hypothetical protein